MTSHDTISGTHSRPAPPGHRLYVSKRRNIPAASSFFEMMLVGREGPREVTTDLAAPLLRVVDDLLPEVLYRAWPGAGVYTTQS